jgi:hypothetical protein
VAVEVINRERWTEQAENVDPTFYGNAAWMDATAEGLNGEPVYAVVQARNFDVLRVALARRRRFGKTFLITPPIAANAGWAEAIPDDLSAERREGRILEATTELAEWFEHQADYVKIAFPPEVKDVRAFLWRGWRPEVRYTYHVSLDEELSTDRVRTNTRRVVERCKNAGLEILHPTGEEAVAMLDATLPPTFTRQSQPLPLPHPLWHTYLQSLVDISSVEVLVAADRDRTPLASIIVGYDTKRAYMLMSGATDDGLSSGAAVYVIWKAIIAAKQRVPVFDLAGANISNIAHFKRGFGGDLVQYLAVSHARSRTVRWMAEDAPGLRQRLLGGSR